MCHSPRGHKESDTTGRLSNSNLSFLRRVCAEVCTGIGVHPVSLRRLAQHGQTHFCVPVRLFLRLPVSAPALHPRAQTQALNAALDCLVLSPHPIQRQVSSVSSPRSLRPRQLLHIRCALAHRDLSFLAGLPVSLSAPCVCPRPSPRSMVSHCREITAQLRPIYKALRIWTCPPPLTFLHPSHPGLPPWVHGAHSGPPPGTLCPRAASSEGPPRTPDPTCALHPSQSPASAQPLLPSLGPTVVLPPSVPPSEFILLLRWLICFLLICLLPTQEYLHKFAGLGAKGKRRCPRSNIRKSSVWPRVSAQASHLGARPSLPITPGRSTY